MTLGELKKYAVKLIDEYSDSATITTDDDIKNKLNGLFNIAQIELCQIDKIDASMKKTQSIPKNTINPQQIQDDLYIHNDSDLVFNGKGKCYHLQIKGIGQIIISQEGSEDIIINNTNDTDFTTYKGFLEHNSDVTITFTGDNYYVTRNVAIFDVNFATVSNIPDYEKYIEYKLPEDFYQLNYITYKGSKLEDYKREESSIRIPSSYVGEIIIRYYKYPTMIDDNTPDSFELELSPKSQMILPYYVASDVLKSDVSANYTSFEAKYNAKLEILNQTKTDSSNTIEIHQLLGNI